MKNTTIITIASTLLLGGTAAADNDPKVTAVLTSYADDFVVPTYKAMADGGLALIKASEALAAKPSDANVKKVIDAYFQARNPWESSESFLFGPAEYANLDPKLDSWPLDQVQLDALLDVTADGKITVDAGYVRDYLGAALRGFHAAEYLLFRDGKARTAKSMTKAEINYLVAVCRVLAEDSIQLEALWAGAESLSDEKKAVLEAAEIEKDGAFAAEIKGAGTEGSRYDSQADAIEEILTGCTDIVVELAGPKFGEPVEAQDAKLFESWYSHTSLADAKLNVKSVKLAYEGAKSGAASISGLVAAKDKALDKAVKASFTKVESCMDAFKAPLAKSLGEKTKFKNIVAACEELAENLEKVKTLLLGN